MIIWFDGLNWGNEIYYIYLAFFDFEMVQLLKSTYRNNLSYNQRYAAEVPNMQGSRASGID